MQALTLISACFLSAVLLVNGASIIDSNSPQFNPIPNLQDLPSLPNFPSRITRRQANDEDQPNNEDDNRIPSNGDETAVTTEQPNPNGQDGFDVKPEGNFQTEIPEPEEEVTTEIAKEEHKEKQNHTQPQIHISEGAIPLPEHPVQSYPFDFHGIPNIPYPYSLPIPPSVIRPPVYTLNLIPFPPQPAERSDKSNENSKENHSEESPESKNEKETENTSKIHKFQPFHPSLNNPFYYPVVKTQIETTTKINSTVTNHTITPNFQAPHPLPINLMKPIPYSPAYFAPRYLYYGNDYALNHYDY